MNRWKSAIDVSRPYWDGYRALIGQLPQDEFPDAAALGRLLPAGTVNRSGQAVRFTPASLLADAPYEKHIFETGQVSTRDDNWHDLFNALVWCLLPRLKAAFNAMHYDHLCQESGGSRGKLRDALTLLDESGVIVLGSRLDVLEALAARDWVRAFFSMRACRSDELRIIVCGHGLLEKFLDPYKSITAHALLVQVSEQAVRQAGDGVLRRSDNKLALELLGGRLFDSPAGLSPLPLMGIPGWWPAGVQDDDFYSDRAVFRLPPAEFRPAPVFRI